MLPTPPIMLKTSSLLFGPLKWAQLFTTYLYLIRRPKGRIVGVTVYAQLLWWGPCDPWWSYELVAEMTVHHVLCLFDENQLKVAFYNEEQDHSPSHLKFFLLIFAKDKAQAQEGQSPQKPKDHPMKGKAKF